MNKILGLIEQISELVISNQHIDEVLHKAVKLIADYLGVESCSIFLFEQQRNQLIIKANFGLNRDVLPFVILKPGEGLVGYTFVKNKMIYEQDAAKSPYYKHYEGLGEERYPSFFGFPILFKKEKIGVFAIHTNKAKKIKESDTTLLKSLISQIAILLKSVQVQEKIQGVSDPEMNENRSESFNARLKGKGVSSGIVLGKVFFISSNDKIEEIPIKKIPADQIAKEKENFQAAVANAVTELETWMTKITENLYEIKKILEAQILLLKDSVLHKKTLDYIQKGYSLESSLKLMYEEYKILFTNIENDYFKERLVDFKDIFSRILSFAMPKEGGRLYKDSILIVNEMFPSYFMELDLSRIKGIITKKMTLTSHSVILAKTFNLPMITGIPEIFKFTKDGDSIILDAEKEEIIINPSRDIVKEYKNLFKNMEKIAKVKIKGKPVTLDGHRVKLSANLGLVHEIQMITDFQIQDVGLYRTEFLFLLRKDFPGVEEQIDVYEMILKRLKGKEVTFRTLDLGGDKQLLYFPLPEEENPLLGLRSIRIFKRHPQILKDQLKALLRVSSKYKCRIMFPMVNNLEDFEFCYSILKEAELELKQDGKAYKIPPLGIMVETPASIFSLSVIAPYISFASVGTNDLLQYLLAVDRNNLYDDEAYNIYDVGFIKTLFIIGEECRKNGLEVSICGEIAGNPLLTPILIGAGFDKLSMTPTSIPLVMQVIQKLDMESVAVICGRVRSKSKALDIDAELRVFYRRLMKS